MMAGMQRTGQRPRFQNNTGFNPNHNNPRFVNKHQHGQINGPKPRGNRDALIARNLEHMKQVSHKKKVAQEMYYGDGRSPLVKTSSGNFVRETARPSVQQRLGATRFANKPHLFQNNTQNTNNINNRVGVNRRATNNPNMRNHNNPNMRNTDNPNMRNPNNSNMRNTNNPNMRNTNNPNTRNAQHIRANSVNNRLNKMNVRNNVVRNVPNQKNNFPRNNIVRLPVAARNNFNNRNRQDKVQRVQNYQTRRRNIDPTTGMVKTIDSKGKIVYLVPSRNFVPRKPATLSVRVDNDRKHHIQNGLNPVLQQEIKIIQAKAGRQITDIQSPSYVPVHQQPDPLVAYGSVTNISAYGDKLPVVSTRQTLNERFSLI